ncbi:MAG: hypothetical protein H0T47_22665 [Planctomycetaceae bacterium]|nr:hypothetical protein [Planctomycetaceae bacterium]
MFFPTSGTAYDLRFSLFGIPVTVSPFFWVMAGLLGFPWLKVEPGGPANLVAWMLCVFVSILIHEFGHAFTMQAFGHRPEVVLHHFGGYATYGGRAQTTPWKSLLISVAGPGVQLVLFGIVVWIGYLLTRESVDWGRINLWGSLFSLDEVVPAAMVHAEVFELGTPLFAIVASLLRINLLWALLNMLPVLPLDGGRMLWALLAMAGVRNSSDWTLRISVVAGVAAAVGCLLMLGSFLAGMMFAFMAMQNYQTLKGQQFGVS